MNRDLAMQRQEAEESLYLARFINRARQEAAASTAEREPVEIDPMVAGRVAALLSRLRKPVSSII